MSTTKTITLEFDCNLESQEETENFVWSILQSGVLNADRDYQRKRWPGAQSGLLRLIRTDPNLIRTIQS